MKKLCILVFMALPLFGLVWSEDPSLTEEQKEERREINKQIAENNMREIQKEKQRWIREQIEKGREQEKEGVDPKTWGPSAAGQDTEEDEPDFYVGGPGSVSPTLRKGSPALKWGRPSMDDEGSEDTMQEDSD